MPAPSDENCANPLLLSWVKEWLDVARERNSKGVTTYRNAYNALKACPLTMSHPCQLQSLKGFGPKLCDRLTEKLKKHCEDNGLPMPRKTTRNPALAALNGNAAEDLDDDEDGPRPPPAKKPRKVKAYVPQYRSGPYGIIMGLAEHNASGMRGLSKAELIDTAQPHCDASYSTTDQANGFYTAWNSMKTLINKELVVEKRAGPRKFYVLTDAGFEVARNMKRVVDPDAVPLEPERQEAGRQPDADEDVLSVDTDREPFGRPLNHAPRATQSEFADIVKDAAASDSVAIPSFRPIRLQPGTFTVELVLDTREIRAKTDRDYMQEELHKQGVKPIVKALELGDALWVAKCHDPNFLPRTGAEGDEVVLDWIVERKRLDDLIGSIKDGRFHEQKFRLKKSGAKNVVYIIEEFNLDERNRSNYELSIQSAIATTQVVNGFFVKQTQKMDDTIRYLVRMTNKLKKQYEDKPLLVIPTGVITRQNYLPLLKHLQEKEPFTGHYVSYPAFSSLASKSEMMTLRDLYLKFLMCTRGVTGEKALEIQKKWKTPQEFIKAFEAFGSGEDSKKRKRDMVFGELGNQFGRKKISRPLSHKIGDIWGDVASPA
ncbi:DNA repair protein [Seiridium cupressi]